MEMISEDFIPVIYACLLLFGYWLITSIKNLQKSCHEPKPSSVEMDNLSKELREFKQRCLVLEQKVKKLNSKYSVLNAEREQDLKDLQDHYELDLIVHECKMQELEELILKQREEIRSLKKALNPPTEDQEKPSFSTPVSSRVRETPSPLNKFKKGRHNKIAHDNLNKKERLANIEKFRASLAKTEDIFSFEDEERARLELIAGKILQPEDVIHGDRALVKQTAEAGSFPVEMDGFGKNQADGWDIDFAAIAFMNIRKLLYPDPMNPAQAKTAADNIFYFRRMRERFLVLLWIEIKRYNRSLPVGEQKISIFAPNTYCNRFRDIMKMDPSVAEAAYSFMIHPELSTEFRTLYGYFKQTNYDCL